MGRGVYAIALHLRDFPQITFNGVTVGEASGADDAQSVALQSVIDTFAAFPVTPQLIFSPDNARLLGGWSIGLPTGVGTFEDVDILMGGTVQGSFLFEVTTQMPDGSRLTGTVLSRTVLTDPLAPAWNAGVTYTAGQTVIADAANYTARVNPGTNLNKFPGSFPDFWTFVSVPPGEGAAQAGVDTAAQLWVSGFTYALDHWALGSDGSCYRSLQNANVGHDPTVSPLWWQLQARLPLQYSRTQIAYINV